VAAKTAGKARRSQLVGTYGVGAIFPAEAESYLICGLDHWYEKAAPVVQEPRLAAALNVDTFRQPPAAGFAGVPVVRFPEWHYCPKCRVLGEHWRIGDKKHSRCKDCRVDLVPSRFVACCTAGHIQDFPYFRWLHRQAEAGARADHRMTIEARGQSSSLADIVLRCSCGVRPRSLEGAMNQGGLVGVTKCFGERRWLPGSEDDECEETPRALQRGSSNVWFPVVRSAISIPSWMDTVPQSIRDHWSMIKDAPAENLPLLVSMAARELTEAERDDIVEAIQQNRDAASDDAVVAESGLRRQEYDALKIGRQESDPGQNFVARKVVVDETIAPVVAQVMEVPRLREVRALQAFTRVTPSAGPEDRKRFAPLTESKPRWLPAIEVLGEGIFLRFDDAALNEWASTDFAQERTGLVQRAIDRRAVELEITPRQLAPRELLLHTFAHVLLAELSLDAGYPTSALRERVYATDEMAGVLIYTASGDAAGSLGGLVAQSRADRLTAVLVSALERATWCTQDPVCIESVGAGSWGLNLAACHACVLLPEVSCENQNTTLDRAVLVGTMDRPSDGFFSRILADR
jgi:hypothetical protein